MELQEGSIAGVLLLLPKARREPSWSPPWGSAAPSSQLERWRQMICTRLRIATGVKRRGSSRGGAKSEDGRYLVCVLLLLLLCDHS